MEWTDVRTFLELARSGSLTRSAQRLDISPSTLSRRIARFEASLGTTLFDRTPDGYRLTDRGHELLPSAEAVEHAAMSFVRRAEGLDREVTGVVRLAAPETVASVLLAPAIARLLDRHPDLRVDLVTGIPTVALTRREADLALRLVRPAQGELLVTRAGQWGHGLFAARRYLKRHPEVERDPWSAPHLVGWSDELAHLPVAAWMRRRVGGRTFRFAAASVAPQVEAVAAGVGVGLLPAYAARRRRGLVELVPPRDALIEDFWLVAHLELRRSPRVRAVREFVETLFKETEGLV